MQRMTKLTATMLVMACTMSAVPQTANASLWGALINLTEVEPVHKPLYVWNTTGRPVRIRVWTNYGEYCRVISKQEVRPSEEWGTRRNTLPGHAIKSESLGGLSKCARKSRRVAMFATPVFKWSEPDPLRNSNRDTFVSGGS